MRAVLSLLIAVVVADNLLSTQRDVPDLGCHYGDPVFADTVANGRMQPLLNMILDALLKYMPFSAGVCQNDSGSKKCTAIPSFPLKDIVDGHQILFVNHLDSLVARDSMVGCDRYHQKRLFHVNLEMKEIGIGMSTKDSSDTCMEGGSCSVHKKDQALTIAFRLGCSADNMKLGLLIDDVDFFEPLNYKLPNGDYINLDTVVIDVFRFLADTHSFHCPDNAAMRYMCQKACEVLM